MQQHDESVDTSDLLEYLICFTCIGDDYLSEQLQRDGVMAKCSYCEEKGSAISINELANLFEVVFEEHFQPTSPDPSDFQYAWMNDPESNYCWEREGTLAVYVIEDVAQIEEEPAEHVRRVLHERNYDFEDAKMGEECPFDEDVQYEEKGVDDYELRAEWSYFEKSLKSETRLFNRRAEGILDSIFEGLTEHATRDDTPVIVDAGPGQSIAQISRARTFQSRDKLKVALEHPDREIGPPPSLAAVAGRMNARGISIFYGTTDPAVAVAEIRPPVGSRVVVACFVIIRPLRLLDVEALQSIFVDGSYFDPSYLRELEKAKFLKHLSSQITMPVMPDDEPSDYLVTQAIADYLANRTEPAIDGIIYRSIQNGAGGLNIALFHKSSRVEILDMPKGTEVEANLESWSDDGPEPDYWVWEIMPKNETEEEGKTEDGFPFGELLDFDVLDRDYDNRPATLQLDLTTVTVHCIESVRFETHSFPVQRHRSEKYENAF